MYQDIILCQHPTRIKMNLIERLENNPDDREALMEAASWQLIPKWPFELSKQTTLEQLGIDNSIYSNIEPAFSELIQTKKAVSCKRYPCNDNALAKFLKFSESKSDIIKPFGFDNIKGIASFELYSIENATIITSPLSILVLDSYNRIIKDCCHNAAESLYLWYKRHRPQAHLSLDTGIFSACQQTFNLGHWLIDSLAELLYTKKIIDIQSKKNLILDTTEHPVIIESLKNAGLDMNKVATLPHKIIKVKKLLVPRIRDFGARVQIVSEFMRKSYSKSNKTLDIIENIKRDDIKFIFLSRQKQTRRRVTNFERIQPILKKYKVMSIFPEEVGLSEMKQIIKVVPNIIAPNGAAVCNSILSEHNTGSTTILYPPSHVDDYYYNVSDSLGRDFYGIFTEDTDKRTRVEDMINNYYFPKVGDNYHIDEDRFSKLLEQIYFEQIVK